MELILNYTRQVSSIEFHSSSPFKFQNISYVEPLYLNYFKFEKEFDVNEARQFMGKINVYKIPLFISIAYICGIYLTLKLMKSRQPYELRTVTLFWNLFLGILSFSGFFRALPEVLLLFGTSGIKDGFHRTVCSWDEHNSISAFWGFLYTISKLFELFGTFLIIVKKRPLIFLHYFHHTVAFMYCFYIYESYDSTMRWFGVTNSFVHGVVYSYLVLKGLSQILGFKISRKWAVRMTILQLVEMFQGVAVNLYTLRAKDLEKNCARLHENIYITLGIYAAFAILFVQYFYSSYVSSDSDRKKQKSN